MSAATRRTDTRRSIKEKEEEERPYRATHSIDVKTSINSGQVFLWKSPDDTMQYYGINGREILRVDADTGSTESWMGGTWGSDTNDFFRNGDDTGAIHRSISTDRAVGEAVRTYPGLRVLRQDPYQCTISFIVSANSNIQKIAANLAKITVMFGDSVKVDGMELSLFPEPSVLAAASVQEIRRCGVGYRAEYIIEASKMVASGEIDFDLIRMESSYENAMDAVLRLPGVGNKVADCIMLFSLDRLDAFPLDRCMVRILQNKYNPIIETDIVNGSLTDRRYRRLHGRVVDIFGPYAGYAQQFLFKMERDGRGARW